MPQHRDDITRLIERMLPKNVSISSVKCGERIRGRWRELTYLPHAIVGEQQISRIDVAASDEARSLASAPTRIGLVHQPALVVHEAVEVSAGASKSLAEVVFTRLEYLGTNRIGDAEDLPEDVDETLFAIQTQQHCGRAPYPCFIDEETYVLARSEIGNVEIGGAIESTSILTERHRPLRLPSPHVQYVIHDDAVQPGSNGAPSFESGKLRDGLDQNFLRCVLRICWMREHANRDVIDPTLVVTDEVLECITIARLGAGNKRTLVSVGAATGIERVVVHLPD